MRRPAHSGTGYVYFTPAEAAFIEAAVARLIPNDPVGPGAVEANVPFFLDRQLAGPFGRAIIIIWADLGQRARPNKVIKAASLPRSSIAPPLLRSTNTSAPIWARAAFAKLAAADQDKVLKGLESGDDQAPMAESTPKPSSAMFLQNTKEGYFSDPIYGGNKDMGAWKMIGFPGAHYNYKEWVTRHGEPRALPAGRLQGPSRLDGGLNMTTTLKPVDAVLVGFGWTGAIMGQQLCDAGLNVVALERGPWRDTATDFATGICAGRAALHVAPSFVSKRHRRHPHRPQQCRSRGVAHAPSGLVPARHRRRQRRRALERPDLALLADGLPDQEPQREALRQEGRL